MPSPRKQSRGACLYCGKEYTKAGMTRHLKTCAKRREAIAAADKRPGRGVTLYHLQVVDNTPPFTRFVADWSSYFWLHLEMRGDATLEDLDSYLRAIWVECCGHLSSFEIGPVHYTQIFEDSWSPYEERDMNVRVDTLFQPGMVIPYLYDFGSTTELSINVIAERKGRPLTRHPITLMARNNPPEVFCMECGEPATWLCVECAYEQENYFLCEDHAEEHVHYEMMLPVVNSPRTSMCGYTGPAEPPY